MHSKDVSTLRISQLGPSVQKVDVLQFFGSNKLLTSPNISLCASSSSEDAPLIGTVTFKSASEAKKGLDLNGRTLGTCSIRLERDFMGFTVLAAPKNPSLEYVVLALSCPLCLRGMGWSCNLSSELNILLPVLLQYMVSMAMPMAHGLPSPSTRPVLSLCGYETYCQIKYRMRGSLFMATIRASLGKALRLAVSKILPVTFCREF